MFWSYKIFEQVQRIQNPDSLCFFDESLKLLDRIWYLAESGGGGEMDVFFSSSNWKAINVMHVIWKIKNK